MLNVFIQRKERGTQDVYWENFVYEKDEHITISILLEEINQCNCKKIGWRPIEWECSCIEGMCGACAMKINRIPRLACQTFCDEIKSESNSIIIQPLSKFPNIVDLVVDRTVMHKNLERMQVWKKENGIGSKSGNDNSELGLCLLCGCCLEVCPSYGRDKNFPGMPTMVAISNIMNQDNIEFYRESIKSNLIDECIRDMNCNKICPIKLPIAENFVNLLRMIDLKV